MGAQTFRESFEAGDIDRLIADLAPEFAFYHTALAEPTTDPELLKAVLVVARETLGDDFRFTEHAKGDGLHALRWTSTIGGIAAEGVDLVREDEQGRTTEIRITMRPMQANAAWSDAMRERFGGRPDAEL